MSPQMLAQAPPAGPSAAFSHGLDPSPGAATHVPGGDSYVPPSPGVLMTPVPSVVMASSPGTLPIFAPTPGIMLTNSTAPGTLPTSVPTPGGSQYSYQAASSSSSAAPTSGGAASSSSLTFERSKRSRTSTTMSSSSSRLKPILEEEVRNFEKKIYYEADPNLKVR